MKFAWNALLLTTTLILVPTTANSESVRENTTNGLIVANEPETDKTDNNNDEETEVTTEEKRQQLIQQLLPDHSEETKNYLNQLAEADQSYQAGNHQQARDRYQKAKSAFYPEAFNPEKVESSRNPYSDPEQLSPGGNVFWGYGKQEFDPKLKSKSLAPLSHLVEQEPDFIPGHIRYAEALEFFDQREQAITHLESIVPQYPEQVELVETLLSLYEKEQQWLDASLTARRFALFNREHERAEEFSNAADEYFEDYRSQLRAKLRGNVIANVITGGVGYALTGSLLGPFSAIESTALLLQGESSVGERLSSRLQEELPLVEDEELNEYVNEIGANITQYSGREDFDYEFYIIKDDNLNAFALPGGKIFINSGAILETDSEAELAGLIAHEIGHVVLSHGFQLITEGNLLANVGQFVPFGRTAANLIVLDYSRDMEREADELGTQLLASTEYAADGIYRLMTTLNEINQNRSTPPAWLSTHPDTAERVDNIKTQIVENNYNRFSFEGVKRHQQMQEKVAQILADADLEGEIDLQGEEEEEEEDSPEEIDLN